MKPIDLSKRRDERDAHKYRLCQAAAYIKRFRIEHGRDATTMQELLEWVSGQPAINPYEVLTQAEVEEAAYGPL